MRYDTLEQLVHMVVYVTESCVSFRGASSPQRLSQSTGVSMAWLMVQFVAQKLNSSPNGVTVTLESATDRHATHVTPVSLLYRK